jgi:hypothetical protein
MVRRKNNCRPYAFLEYLFEETSFGIKVLAVLLETFLLIFLYFLSFGLIFLKNNRFVCYNCRIPKRFDEVNYEEAVEEPLMDP